MAETTLEKTEGRMSYHDSVEEMLKKIREDGMTNVFDRYAQQEKIRCKFCLEGLSCQLCSHGPCRWNVDKGIDKGVCGIGPDANAMRNLLIQNTLAAGTYSHHAYEAFRTLKAIGEGKSPFKIKDENKPRWMCEKVGIDNSGDVNSLAIKLADLLEAQQNIGVEEKTIMVEAFAPKKRKEVWKKLNIYPAGTVHEEQNCVASPLTNVDGDYASLALKAFLSQILLVNVRNLMENQI